ncbi:MAG: Uma2 family endonuclease [Halothiobacillaceae bacterium]|nr:Uma2 family endonuclease [Halothiobacillaceae bacterium]
MTALYASNELVSVDDYLEGEKSSELRHEFIDGQVYAMGGASRAHGLIANALAFALTPAARRKGCQLFTSDMKVRLDFSGRQVFYYPDVVLSCDPSDRDPFFSTRPCLIIEVLSAFTARVDRREKLLAYQTLPSLLEYVLVAQDRPLVEVYRRSTAWLAEVVTQGEFRLECLDMSVALKEVYTDVEFPPPEVPYSVW